MIIKVSRWKDKMATITDRRFRDNLEKRDDRMANDLTRDQSSIVTEAKNEGKVAYFKKRQAGRDQDDQIRRCTPRLLQQTTKRTRLKLSLHVSDQLMM